MQRHSPSPLQQPWLLLAVRMTWSEEECQMSVEVESEVRVTVQRLGFSVWVTWSTHIACSKNRGKSAQKLWKALNNSATVVCGVVPPRCTAFPVPCQPLLLYLSHESVSLPWMPRRQPLPFALLCQS